jgi:hypothetical protein
VRLAAFAARRTNQPNILLHIERLQHIRNLEMRSDLGQLIHQNRLLQIAREGAATAAQHIARFDEPRRYGTLVAVLLEASSTLTDEILDLHDRFVGSIFNKARRRRDEAFQSSGKAINEKVRLYARIGQALLAAKEDGDDLLPLSRRSFRGLIALGRSPKRSNWHNPKTSTFWPYLKWVSADAPVRAGHA